MPPSESDMISSSLRVCWNAMNREAGSCFSLLPYPPFYTVSTLFSLLSSFGAAYETLTNATKRKRYDFLLTQGVLEYDEQRSWGMYDPAAPGDQVSENARF